MASRESEEALGSIVATVNGKWSDGKVPNFGNGAMRPPPCTRWPGILGSCLAGHCPWVLVWTGACYWHGVGGFMFNSSSSRAHRKRAVPLRRRVCRGRARSLPFPALVRPQKRMVNRTQTRTRHASSKRPSRPKPKGSGQPIRTRGSLTNGRTVGGAVRPRKIVTKDHPEPTGS